MTNGQDPKRGRGRPRNSERQGTFDDLRLEDEEIDNCLTAILECTAASERLRAANKKLKERLENAWPQVINSERDGIHSGYVITAGGFRFRPRTQARLAGEVTINVSAGQTWRPLEVERPDGLNS